MPTVRATLVSGTSSCNHAKKLGDIQHDRSIIAMIVTTTEGNEPSVDETLDKRQKTMSDDLLSMLEVSTNGQ